MKTGWVLWIIMTFMTAACGGSPSSSTGKSEGVSVPKVIVEKEKTEKEQPLPPEVKIRLKRDGKENYSWELSGTDVDQILKVNEKMRKQVGGEKTR